ncbi:MAG: thiamine-phosphate pyrophosphorylase [Sulfurimonadaceae bacterium]|jgi:thiamine-phosphate pyrophosphorylase|nr:thiamine-phosphate pyrophosphorylase [Sulfurimonadaceae bacterium]
MTNTLLRTLDANLNRLREGIRVVEDILRYTYNDKTNSAKLKNLRHKIKPKNYIDLLEQRDSANDVLRPSTNSELKREDIVSIIIANFKRAQESSRVLEEIYKLEDIGQSENFKNIRYELYVIEKEVLLTFAK